MLSVLNWHLGDYMDDRMAIWREESVYLYQLWATHQMGDIYYDKRAPYFVERCTLDFTELRGKVLACWCPLTYRCHADVLLELANV